MQSISAIGIVLFLMNGVYSMKLRSVQYAPRSVPGRIKSSSDPSSLKDYFLNYLSSVRHHQQPQYGLPEYVPPYYQITPEAISALMPYLSQSNQKDYSYDYNTLPESDTDDWYDDHDSNGINMAGDGSSQDAALLQLFLDHLDGKYSLEDLETLEREAAIEDNTENQLQALMDRKKATAPVIKIAPSLKQEMKPFRRGQKEEVIMLPATAMRRPIFTRNVIKEEKSAIKTVAKKENHENVMKAPFKSEIKHEETKMEPMVKSAYDSLRRYLDRQRIIKQAADEEGHIHTTQKRFISEPKVLTEQLVNLKKIIS